MIIALSPCQTDWDYEPKESVTIGKLAVKTGIWPLKEYIDGQVVHTRIPRERLPVEEYLQLQGRYAVTECSFHCFRSISKGGICH